MGHDILFAKKPFNLPPFWHGYHAATEAGNRLRRSLRLKATDEFFFISSLYRNSLNLIFKNTLP